MAVVGAGSSSVSGVATAVSSPFRPEVFRLGLLRVPCGSRSSDTHWLSNSKAVKAHGFIDRAVISNRKFQNGKNTLCTTSVGHAQDNEVDSDALEETNLLTPSEESSSLSSLYVPFEGTDGKPGLLSFYNRPYGREDKLLKVPQGNQNNLKWILGPAVLVTSFIFPSLYLRRILCTIFEDSLLTDFLILFFTEALFYCGVAIFLLLIDCMRRPLASDSADEKKRLAPQLVHRISSVTALVLSLTVPMVTMGFVWPWTGPAASAALAPYLVGITVQFAFEQYARYRKSPSMPVIPIIFQVYRLHQLNRAAQLVTALSFTVRGAEVTPNNLAINSSLSTLLNVLQFLGVICIWSLSSILMRIFTSSPITAE
ncbi:hypothetical protein NL676_003282 [Syzygium grande]|nr:hypothetical protein NL676_003282 [Syzygium grande]